LVVWEDLNKLPVLKHTILRVELKSGKEYAVDLSGAQFGWHEAILLWDEYVEKRVKEIDAKKTSGFGARKKARETEWSKGTNVHTIACMANGNRFTKRMGEILEGWGKEEGKTVRDVLRLEKESFEREYEGLLGLIDGELGKFMEMRMKSQALIVKAEKTESMGASGIKMLHFEFTEGDGNVAKWDSMVGPYDEMVMGLEDESSEEASMADVGLHRVQVPLPEQRSST
jgi:hypothetical protein